MHTQVLIKIFERDLSKLESELQSYKSESNLWLLPKGINNTAGNLALHIVGNLNHYIGAILGKTGYIRKRDLEFSDKDVPLNIILEQVKETKVLVNSILKELKEEDLKKTYPISVVKEEMTTAFFLTHLTTHLSYHLGQINYHRRLLDE